MSRPFRTDHTPKSIRKMSTEQMHRLFQHLYGHSLFNPFEDRQFMIVTLIGHFDTRTTLELAQASEANRAMQQSARAQYEQMVTSRKYTDAQVATIRAMRDEGYSFRALATEFNGSLKGIEKVAKGITYTTPVGSTLVPTIPGLGTTEEKIVLPLRDTDTTDEWLTSLGF